MKCLSGDVIQLSPICRNLHPNTPYRDKLSVEKADFRMMTNSKHAFQHGFTRIILVSADTGLKV